MSTTMKFNKLNGSAVKSDVKYMKLSDGDNVFRILPDSVVPMYQYWIKGANGKELPFECLQFVRGNEKFDNSLGDPVKDMGVLDAKDEPIKCQWSYKCRVINKATGLVEVLQLKKGMLSEIISVASQLEMDPTDLDTGTWITCTRKKTGPLPFNVEYTVQQLKCKATSLSDEDRAKLVDLKTMDELFPVETYEKQLERLSKHLNGLDNEETQEHNQEAVNELS